jgi:DnaJ-class molecular chaperone
MNPYVQQVFSPEDFPREEEEVECKRCYGTGEDPDGADCVPCVGNGTVIL